MAPRHREHVDVPGDSRPAAAHARALASALAPVTRRILAPLRVELHDAGDGARRRAVWRRLTRLRSFTGERGAGKNLIARAIHAFSPRRDGPNCAAPPTERLDAELFGHEKGAFTGPIAPNPASSSSPTFGTICLDEIGEMPRVLQAKRPHILRDFQFRASAAAIRRRSAAASSPPPTRT